MTKVCIVGGMIPAGVAAGLLGTADRPIVVTEVEDLQPMFDVAQGMQRDYVLRSYGCGLHVDEPVRVNNSTGDKPHYTALHKRWGR